MKQDELKTIRNLEGFIGRVKIEALSTFMITYQKSSKFIEKYDEDFLSRDIIEYESKRFLLYNEELQAYNIYKGDIERVIKAVYKELVEQVLNKLVDEGELELCWDAEEKNFLWRHAKGKNRGRRYKKESGR